MMIDHKQPNAAVRHVKVSEDEDGTRLDRFLARQLEGLSFARAQALIRKGEVRVNGKRGKNDQRLAKDDDVRLPPFSPPAQEGFDGRTKPTSQPPKAISPKLNHLVQDLLKRMVWHNDDVLVLVKPAGLAVQGGTGLTLHLDAALPLLAEAIGVDALRLVHRLDKDTSGLIVLAKTRKAAHSLTRAFADREVGKDYLALCLGAPAADEGDIDVALAKTRSGSFGREAMRPKMMEDGGRRAITSFSVVERAGGHAFSLILAQPKTGRNHQIRAHLATLGCPIIGDGKYGGVDAREAMRGATKTNFLHLHALALTLPEGVQDGGKRLVAPLSQEFQTSLRELGLRIPTELWRS